MQWLKPTVYAVKFLAYGILFKFKELILLYYNLYWNLLHIAFVTSLYSIQSVNLHTHYMLLTVVVGYSYFVNVLQQPVQRGHSLRTTTVRHSALASQRQNTTLALRTMSHSQPSMYMSMTSAHHCGYRFHFHSIQN